MTPTQLMIRYQSQNRRQLHLQLLNWPQSQSYIDPAVLVKLEANSEGQVLCGALLSAIAIHQFPTMTYRREV